MGAIKAAQRCVNLLRVPWLAVRDLESKPSTLPLGAVLGCWAATERSFSSLSIKAPPVQNEKVGCTRKLAADSDICSKVGDRELGQGLGLWEHLSFIVWTGYKTPDWKDMRGQLLFLFRCLTRASMTSGSVPPRVLFVLFTSICNCALKKSVMATEKIGNTEKYKGE